MKKPIKKGVKANKVVKKSTPKKTNPTKKLTNKKTTEIKPRVKLVATKQGLVEVKINDQTEVKKDTRKYIKVYENDPLEKRKEISERVFKKELKFAYYASEGAQGVWYYVII